MENVRITSFWRKQNLARSVIRDDKLVTEIDVCINFSIWTNPELDYLLDDDHREEWMRLIGTPLRKILSERDELHAPPGFKIHQTMWNCDVFGKQFECKFTFSEVSN